MSDSVSRHHAGTGDLAQRIRGGLSQGPEAAASPHGAELRAASAFGNTPRSWSGSSY